MGTTTGFEPDGADAGPGFSRIAALAEPVRRDLYRYVAAARDAVSREQAADGVGVPAHTAKFHLERLVDEGLLEVEFKRLSGRSGPGAGRPAKMYRRASGEVTISVPERHYDLLSRILAAAIAESSESGAAVRDVAARIARDEGRRLGIATDAPDGVEELSRLAAVLAGAGYEPWLDDDTLVLSNCPFHRVAQEQTELVCGLNLEYVTGVADGLACSSVATALDPGDGRCCVSARQATGRP